MTYIKGKLGIALSGIGYLTVWKILPKHIRKNILKKKYLTDNYKKLQNSEQFIIEAYKNEKNQEILKILNYIKTKGLSDVFPYDFCTNYHLKAALSINYDDSCGMFYMKRHGRKLYMKNTNSTEAIMYYNSILSEQDYKSPHLYVERKKDIKGKYLLDCGAAEGFFALDHLDDFEHIYLYEASQDWLSALNKTFEPYKNKVTIINEFVSNKVEKGMITLDSFIESQNFDLSERMFIKIDIEGEEIKALQGMSKLLNKSEKLFLCICTYHKAKDEEEIRKILLDVKGIKVETTKGYMIYYHDDNAMLRRGLIKAEKNYVI